MHAARFDFIGSGFCVCSCCLRPLCGYGNSDNVEKRLLFFFGICKICIIRVFERFRFY